MAFGEPVQLYAHMAVDLDDGDLYVEHTKVGNIPREVEDSLELL